MAKAENVDPKKEAQQLKLLLAKARDASANIPFAVSLGKGKDPLAFIVHKKKKSEVLKKEAKNKTGSSKTTHGTLVLDGKNLTLKCKEEPPSGLQRKMKEYFKSNKDLPTYKCNIMLPNGKVVGDDDVEEEEETEVAAAGGRGNGEDAAAGAEGAAALGDDFLDDIMGAVEDATGMEEADIEDAIDDDMLDDIAAAVEEAGGPPEEVAAEDFLDDDMFDDIASAAGIEEEEEEIQAAAPAGGNEEIEKAVDNRKAFKKAREIWVAARDQANADLEKVKQGAREAYMDDVQQFPVVQKSLKDLDEILDNLSDDLRKTLNAYVSTPLRNKAKMDELADEAKGMVGEYIKYVNSSPLLDAIDEKEFADVTMKAPLKKALQDLQKSIV